MNYEELINHILENARVYYKEYSQKSNLNDYQRGIIRGLWMDIDSIKNHLEIKKINGIQEASKLEKELNIEKIMKELEDLL